MRVDSVKYACEFDLHNDVILELGPALSELRKQKGVQVQILNVPASAPPPAPRMVLQTPNLVANVSLNRYDIIVKVPPHVTNSVSATVSFSRSVLAEALQQLVVQELGYSWGGLILELRIPQLGPGKRGIDALRPVVNHLVRLSTNPDQLASFQLQLGYERDGFFEHYQLGGYEMANFSLNNIRPNQFVEIPSKSIQFSEAGLNVVVDVNNRPTRPREDALGDLAQLCEKVVELAGKLPSTLALEGIINVEFDA